jgi:hypothetical protein
MTIFPEAFLPAGGGVLLLNITPAHAALDKVGYSCKT